MSAIENTEKKDSSAAGTKAKESRDPEEIREDIAEPASAQDGVQQAQRLVQENPVPMALGGAFLAGIAFGKLLSR